jgi:acetylornithine deacetylase/succinyl-diaminopimelate desuccinylase-like protein
MATNDALTAEVTDLLQQLIRNQCVNDGTIESGEEIRSVDLLQQYLGSTGVDTELYEPQPGRTSMVSRIEGSDPSAPSLLLMGHTDVVPVNPDGWHRDPFGAELVDGEVWGRGAVDMLNLTASMTVAFKHLAQEGFKPKGTLVYLAVADEEALGTWGARWLVDHEPDAVVTDFVITESGGFQMPTPSGARLPVMVEEKGTYWSTLLVRGTPGHGSQPFRTDNALVTAAEVVRRLNEYKPETRIGDTWRRYVEEMGFPAELSENLLSPDRLDKSLDTMPPALARLTHACTHLTIAPTMMRAGTKQNVIPDVVELKIDVRTLPGQSGDEVHAALVEALGDLADRVEIHPNDDPSTSSPPDTRLWDVLNTVSARLVEGSALVPFLMTGGTDNRFFRRAGSVGYGFGLFSSRLRFEDYASMFHGNDERVDQESLRLSTELWMATARELLT